MSARRHGVWTPRIKMPVYGAACVSFAAIRDGLRSLPLLLLAVPLQAVAAEPPPDASARFLQAADTFEQARAGSAAAERYALYQVGMTLDAALAAGIWRADIRWCLKKRYIKTEGMS